MAAALRNPAGHVVLNDYSLIGRRSNKRLLPLMANFTLRALICDRLFKMRVLQVPAEQILPEEERNHRSQDKVWAERHRRAPLLFAEKNKRDADYSADKDAEEE